MQASRKAPCPNNREYEHDWQQYLYHVAIRGQKGTLAKYMDDRLKKRIKKMVKKDLQKQKQKTSSNRNLTL